MKGPIDEDGNRKVLSNEELNLIFEKRSNLSTSSIRILIHDARMTLNSDGYIDSILKLKKWSLYDYIQDSCFPGHKSDLTYIFKMSMFDLGSGVGFVRRMQPGGNLASQLIMFDPMKRIYSWTTLGIHVYDPIHRKVMTICICDMKSEMAEHQKQMWKSTLLVMEKHGIKMSISVDLWQIVLKKTSIQCERYLAPMTRSSLWKTKRGHAYFTRQ